MADASDPIIQECRTCGALIDTSAEQPLALIHCPTCGAAMRVRRMFDQFELQEVLGAGGMGAVYRAFDTKLNRAVALKVLREEHMDNADLIASLTKEASITASINHPHVVKVYTTGTAHGGFYIAMELVDKGSLDDLMALQGKVGELQVLEVGIQIAQGLNAALQRGLIHRDVKPGNILFADANTARITDFGLAVLQEHVHQLSGEVWGTPYYVAPEKLDTPPTEDFRSDMYSLGATLFHALAGRPPFEAETASMVALKHLKSQAVSLQSFAPEVSSATAYVINKALSKDPQDRYERYEDFIKSLQYAHDELLEATRHPRKKRRVVMGEDSEVAMSWITFAMVGIIVLAGVLLFTFRDQIFGEKSTERPNPAAVAGQEARTAFDREFAAASALLAAGKYGEAAAALRALEAKPDLPQPLRSWVGLHASLAFFLLGQPDEARADLEKIEGRGTLSAETMEPGIATFFTATARLAAKPEVQPAAVAANYDKASYESFALLLFAAKNWSLGAFEEAGPLFLQFRSATPPDHSAWIGALKPIAETFIADYNTYRPAAEAARLADSPEKQQQALAALRTARGQLRQRGRLIEFFDAEEGRLEKLLRLHEEKQMVVKADDEAADRKRLAEVRLRLDAFCAQYKFVEAARVVAEVKVTSERGQAERALWQNWAGGLAKFKATLINDINAKGYTQPVAKKNGSSLPAGRLRASDAQVEVVSPFGSVSATWPDLAVNSVIGMAATFMRAETTPLLAERQWQLGLFLLHAGLKTQGGTLLQQAAQSRPDYQELLPGIQETFGR